MRILDKYAQKQEIAKSEPWKVKNCLINTVYQFNDGNVFYDNH